MARAKKYEMTYNAEHNTVAANDIIKGKQSMTLQTARLIRLLVTQIAEKDKDLKTYTCRITDLAKFFNIDSSNLYKEIFKICECALDSKVYIGTGNPKHPWEMFHWISMASYDGKGTITLRLSDEIKPYVLELEKWFTQYKLKDILGFNSYYAIRLYEIIQCVDGETSHSQSELEFEVEELRQYFDCEKKYAAFKDFRKRVIEVAVREINEKSDIWLKPTYKKWGRAYTSVSFEIHANFKRFAKE